MLPSFYNSALYTPVIAGDLLQPKCIVQREGIFLWNRPLPPHSYNSALSKSSCWCFGQKLQFLVLFLLTQGSKTFLNSTCLSLNGAVTQEVQLMSNGLKKTYWIVLRKVRTFRRHQQTASISCMLHAVKVRFLQYPILLFFLGFHPLPKDPREVQFCSQKQFFHVSCHFHRTCKDLQIFTSHLWEEHLFPLENLFFYTWHYDNMGCGVFKRGA